MFDRIKRAWSFWVLANMSFGSKLNGGFGYSKSIGNKRDQFTEDLAKRIKEVLIECCDALKIISSHDSTDTLFYLDPPYVGTHQGHYDGYSQSDFNELLEQLTKINGKFLLSSFCNNQLTAMVNSNHWYQIELKRSKPMSAHSGTSSKKTEVLTANYPIGVVENVVTLL